MKKLRLYRKLAAGRQFGLVNGGWLSLHLGPDHLLLRTSSGFAESYRRFYFADIEAITICQTLRGLFWNVGYGFGLFLSVMPIMIRRGPHPFAWSLVALFTVLLLINVLRGPTCFAQLQTRVQKRRLPLRRIRKALRVIDQLSATIVTAQGEIAAALPNPTRAVTHSAPTQPTAGIPPPMPAERVPSAGWLHLATFAVLVASSAVAFLSALQPQNAALAYGTYAIVLANLTLGVITLVRQHGRPVPSQIRPLAWISVIGHGIAVPTVFTIYSFVYSFQNLHSRRTPPDNPFSTQLPLDALRGLPGFTEVLVSYGVCALLLGLAGGVMFAISARGRGAAAI